MVVLFSFFGTIIWLSVLLCYEKQTRKKVTSEVTLDSFHCKMALTSRQYGCQSVSFDFTSTLHTKKSVQSGYERRAKRYKRSTFFLERTRKDHRQLHQRWNRFKGSAGGKLTEGMGRISDKRRVNGSNYKAGCFFACLFLFFIEVCGSKRSAGCFEWQEKSQ